MIDPANVMAETNDFEFEALEQEQTQNYREALFQEFRDFLKEDVLEVGAGIGQMTERLVRMPEIKRAVRDQTRGLSRA
jgi:2-polyprenyl-3-methyl-5-hydroxy-6-metoxy-1,4-benzoquinol methylase